MVDKDVVDSLKQISANLETINNTIKEVCAKSKEVKKNEEREFQLRMLNVQLGSDVFASIISVIMSMMVAIITVIITLVVGFSDVVPSHITIYLIAYPIAVTIVTSIVCWAVFGVFRNRRIKEIEQEFIKNKNAETKGK